MHYRTISTVKGISGWVLRGRSPSRMDSSCKEQCHETEKHRRVTYRPTLPVSPKPDAMIKEINPEERQRDLNVAV